MMKKNYLILILVLFLTTGCNPKTGTMTCSMTVYPTEDIKLQSTYVATYKNNIVTKLTTTEQVTTKTEEELKTYKEKVLELYQNYQNIKYYKNNVKTDGKTLTSTTVIQYDKIDTKKLIAADSDNANIIKNGKVDIDDLKKIYKQNGCNCKKEG